MAATPEKASRSDAASFTILGDQISSPRRSVRVKRPPPITPRRFNRFFTPRQTNVSRTSRGLRRALRDIPKASLNSRQNQGSTPPKKKRKLSFQSIPSSIPSSPVRRVGFLSSSQELGPAPDKIFQENENDSEASTDVEEKPTGGCKVITTYPRRSTSTSLLSRRLTGKPFRARIIGDGLHLHETANFCSVAADINTDNGSSDGQQHGHLPLPFCSTACNTNSLVAIGDEEGHVRLIDSTNESTSNFAKSFLVMKPHDNAIMDLGFSEDDALLATASGDQTCHVIDVKTQKSVWSLSGHTSSVKKVQFQPGSTHLLATCARDGAILIWDTRENHTDSPAHTVQLPITDDISGVQPKHSIVDAHLGRLRSRPGTTGGRGDFSVTSLAFIDPSRPNLFTTASESDSVVKLWDMRSTHRYKRKTIPISCTREPKAHETHRRFGITSLAISTDHSKLYTLCRDHTVYAYSTSHLLLGSSSEFSASSKPFQVNKGHTEPHTSLGPIYGFRHPALQVSTFYPKLSVRKATDATSEVIAVGSSDDCAVLFPTHERYLTATARRLPQTSMNTLRDRPRLTRTDSQSASLSFIYRRHLNDVHDPANIPIYYHGTPLIRGHNKEVTAVTWSSEGGLVTISDDFKTRCWREDAEKARQLRNPEEGEAERWGCGWADVKSQGWDDEDC